MVAVGIYTRYQKHDATFAAISLASYLRKIGVRVSLCARGWRASNVNPLWDNLLVTCNAKAHSRARDKKRATVSASWSAWKMWCRSHTCIVWTEPPSEEELFFARHAGLKTILWSSWEKVHDDYDWAINMVDAVLVPSYAQRDMFRRRFKLHENDSVLDVVPYVPDLPVTVKDHKSLPHDSPCIFVSLFGSQLRRVNIGSISSLSRILRACPRAKLVVACSRGLSRAARYTLQYIYRTYTDRVVLIPSCPWHTQMQLMAASQLTLWPAVFDGFGLIGITSLHMGTPVVAFDAPPFSEYLHNTQDSILVPSRVDRDGCGAARVTADYKRYEACVVEMIRKPDIIAGLTSNTAKHLNSLRSSFTSGWSRHLEL